MSVTLESFLTGLPCKAHTRVNQSEGDVLLLLFKRVQTADVRAFAELFDRTKRHTFALAHSIARNKADAEDVVSCVYQQAWETASSYDANRGSVRTWLNAICRSRSLDLLRRRHVHQALDERLASYSADSVSISNESQLDQVRQISALHKVLGTLSPMRRRLLQLSFFGELTHLEISKMLGLPLGTVKSHLRRTLVSLRQPLS